MARRRIAYIGSSYKFVHQSVRDFILCKRMEDTDLVLWDINPDPLQIEHDVIAKMITQGKSAITVRKATSRADALQGADYVVVSVLVGGMDVAEKEDLICQKYGVRHTVGDTVGPMCTARNLRMVPLLLDIARDMERLCPKARMLNVTNPMAVLTNSVNRHSKIECIGICHGTYFRQKMIADAYHVSPCDVLLNVVGVNHLGFIDKIRVKGVEKNIKEVADAISELAKKGHEDVAGYQDTDEWANTFARRMGVIPNNGDHHFVEFFHWFLNPHAFANGKNIYGLDHALHSADGRRKRAAYLRDIVSKWAYGHEPIPDMDKYSAEHIHDIIFGLEGIHGDTIQRELHLNVSNGRAVPNLPAEANIEVTCHISANGIQPVMNDPLPPFTLGQIMPHVCLNLLSEKAAVNRDKRAFLEALHLDPLVTDFRSIPEMADELWVLNEPYMTPVK
jgi:alpha-galactosidase